MSRTEYRVTCDYLSTPNGRSNDDALAVADEINRTIEDCTDRAAFERELVSLDQGWVKAVGLTVVAREVDPFAEREAE